MVVINGTPSICNVNVDESGQQDWIDKRNLQCYILADNPCEELTISNDRSSHRSTVLVGISLSGKLLKPLVVVKRTTIDSELVELGYGRSAMYQTSQTAFVNTVLYQKWELEVVIPYLNKNRTRIGYDGPAYILQDGFSGHDIEGIK